VKGARLALVGSDGKSYLRYYAPRAPSFEERYGGMPAEVPPGGGAAEDSETRALRQSWQLPFGLLWRRLVHQKGVAACVHELGVYAADRGFFEKVLENLHMVLEH